LRKVDVDAIESLPGAAVVKRKLTDELGTTDLALVYYELVEGESSSFGYHAHGAQEEVFYVQQGAVTVRAESETVTVTSGEVVRVPPGELQRAVNERTERAVVLVVGAPQEAGELTLFRFCEACDDETLQEVRDVDPGSIRETVCSDCGHVTGRFTK
jgi:mannose-6-phosphate isomerase-like protein (cupin superfamily)